ncbi:vicilin-like seed storage protein At2g18540 isoform X2 [Monomorium pharaonis]|uniref:vicilin-like seed storage protein At2g18540 isoform X2 n=1 Tax=Monomorium pharaonis TaxID=307658 RepID=UPI001747D15E|nr:vicilin-like seed storage protein At2g18540 isoform X2 [Monomorium pharaonis]
MYNNIRHARYVHSPERIQVYEARSYRARLRAAQRRGEERRRMLDVSPPREEFFVEYVPSPERRRRQVEEEGYQPRSYQARLRAAQRRAEERRRIRRMPDFDIEEEDIGRQPLPREFVQPSPVSPAREALFAEYVPSPERRRRQVEEEGYQPRSYQARLRAAQRRAEERRRIHGMPDLDIEEEDIERRDLSPREFVQPSPEPPPREFVQPSPVSPAREALFAEYVPSPERRRRQIEEEGYQPRSYQARLRAAQRRAEEHRRIHGMPDLFNHIDHTGEEDIEEEEEIGRVREESFERRRNYRCPEPNGTP